MALCQNPECGKEFTPSRNQLIKGQGKFCCRTCKDTSQRKMISKHFCKKCGSEFTPSKQSKGLYCSRACFQDYNRRHTSTCTKCGKVFVPKVNTAGKFCSPECAGLSPAQPNPDIICDYCHNVFHLKGSSLRKFDHKFCSRQCFGLYSRANRHRELDLEPATHPKPKEPGTDIVYDPVKRELRNE